MNVPLLVAIPTVTLAAVAAWAGVRARHLKALIITPIPVADPAGSPPRPTGREAPDPPTGRVPSARSVGPRPSARLGLVTVYSAKGGSGVSTIAANLAIAIRRERNSNVALADMDFQSGDAGFLLGLSGASSLPDAPTEPRVDLSDVLGALVEHESGIHVMPQPDHIDAGGPTSAQQAVRTLDVLCALFDTVIVDAPHLLIDVTVDILERSGDVLLVVTPDVPSLRAARRSLDVLARRRAGAVPGRMLVIVNRFSEKSPVSLAQIEETLDLPIFATIVEDSEAVSLAGNCGRPLSAAGAARSAARDIAAIAKRLVGKG